MVTPDPATCREVPATYPVRPVRAELDRPRTAIGALTDCEVMFTTLPQPFCIIAGNSAFIRAIGVSILASSALMKSSRSQSVHMPGGGPPALVTRISTSPAAASTLARPSSLVMSAAMASTSTPYLSLISLAAACNGPSVRAFITRCTPSAAKASAHPRPNPFDDAHTSARFPAIPVSIANSPASNDPTCLRHA